MTTLQHEASVDKRLFTIAKSVSGRYARSVWWIERDDLMQQAMLTVTEARRSFDPSLHKSIYSYAFQACVFSLKRQLRRQSSPVSGGVNGQNTALRAPLMIASNEDSNHEEENPCVYSSVKPPSQEDALIADETMQAVRSALSDIATAQSIPLIAINALLEDVTLEEAADHIGCSTACMRAYCHRLKSLALYNKQLHALWKKVVAL